MSDRKGPRTGGCGLEQNKLSPKTNRKSLPEGKFLESEINPRGGTGRKLRRAVGKVPGNPSGARAGSAPDWGVGSSSAVSGACESPPPPPSRALLTLLSGAAGCSWPQTRPRLGTFRARRPRLHIPGPGDPSPLPRRPHRSLGAKTSASAGARESRSQK